MHARLYVWCIYVCMYVCIHVHTYICMLLFKHVLYGEKISQLTTAITSIGNFEVGDVVLAAKVHHPPGICLLSCVRTRPLVHMTAPASVYRIRCLEIGGITRGRAFICSLS